MKKIYRYYNNNTSFVLDIKVVADDLTEAIDLVWEFFIKSPDWDHNYVIKKNLNLYITEFKITESGILSIDSAINDLAGHFD